MELTDFDKALLQVAVSDFTKASVVQSGRVEGMDYAETFARGLRSADQGRNCGRLTLMVGEARGLLTSTGHRAYELTDLGKAFVEGTLGRAP